MNKKKSIRSAKNRGYYKEQFKITEKNKKTEAERQARKKARGITFSMRKKSRNIRKNDKINN